LDCIEINIDQYLEAQSFTVNVIKTNLEHYASRNQKNFFKIYNDILLGKIAEYAVYNYLKSKGGNVSEVDTQIYASKSFDCDLKCDGMNIHIKSCREDGDSWVFQKSDPLVKNPTEKDYIFCCRYKGNKVEIVKIIKGLDAKYLNPRLKNLTSKVCIYN
jgi:hypothetical protein